MKERMKDNLIKVYDKYEKESCLRQYIKFQIPSPLEIVILFEKVKSSLSGGDHLLSEKVMRKCVLHLS